MKWLLPPLITNNVVHIFSASEPAILIPTKYSVEINDIRVLRNYVAHRSASTRSQYVSLIKRKHCPTSIAIEPGLFLMSTARARPAFVDRYIVSSRVLAKDLARA